MTTEESQKALVKAIWTCIVDASSMNVVMHGAEVNAAIRDFRAAIEAEAVAPLVAALYNCGLAAQSGAQAMLARRRGGLEKHHYIMETACAALERKL